LPKAVPAGEPSRPKAVAYLSVGGGAVSPPLLIGLLQPAINIQSINSSIPINPLCTFACPKNGCVFLRICFISSYFDERYSDAEQLSIASYSRIE
jgi:hypothetical protein